MCSILVGLPRPLVPLLMNLELSASIYSCSFNAYGDSTEVGGVHSLEHRHQSSSICIRIYISIYSIPIRRPIRLPSLSFL